MMQQKYIDRFWSYVKKGDGCWKWVGGHTKQGYGLFHIWPGVITTHRLSWELANGSIPDGLFVCHRCDNRGCVRPDHLFLGTNMDNVKDMISKGRNPKGAAHHLTGTLPWNVKFSFEKADEAREAFASGESRLSIAKRMSVSVSVIERVVLGKSWVRKTS